MTTKHLSIGTRKIFKISIALNILLAITLFTKFAIYSPHLDARGAYTAAHSKIVDMCAQDKLNNCDQAIVQTFGYREDDRLGWVMHAVLINQLSSRKWTGYVLLDQNNQVTYGDSSTDKCGRIEGLDCIL